jgi:hypothetical protein
VRRQEAEGRRQNSEFRIQNIAVLSQMYNEMMLPSDS